MSRSWRADLPTEQASYDADSLWYDDVMREPGEDVDFWLQFVEPRMSVCDLGCGTGRLLSRIDEVARVIGIDISPNMLSVADSRTPDSVELRLGDIREIPAASEEFDLLLCVRGAVAHLMSTEDQISAIREMNRVLKPGGRAVVDLPYFGANHHITTQGEARSKYKIAHSGHDYVVETTYRRVGGWHHVESERQIYRARRFGRGGLVHSLALRTRMMSAPELVLLMEIGKFHVDHFLGSTHGEEWHDSSDRLIAVVSKPLDGYNPR